jgi:dihydrodipicolinate synthase/N-acetylneuraminate lyase
MMRKTFTMPLHGIIPPMVTPLTESGCLDIEGTERLIDHLLTGSVAGLFLLGTTGEGLSLSIPIREELIRRTCQQVSGRIPVLVGISSTCMEESLQMARMACENGADAVVATPPFYILPTASELGEYLNALVSQLPLPLFLYNMPALTRITWDLNLVRSAMENPKIIGIKDSSGDMKYFQYLCGMGNQRPDWAIYMGSEELLVPAIHAGAHGGVSGGANVFPSLYAALHQNAENRNDRQTAAFLSLAKQVQQLLFPFSSGIGDGIRHIKSALAVLGLCGNATAPPLHRLSAEKCEALKPQIDALQREITGALAVHELSPPHGTHFRKLSIDGTLARG